MKPLRIIDSANPKFKNFTKRDSGGQVVGQIESVGDNIEC